MNAAIQANRNWTSGNTAVYFDETSGTSVVRLHGNKIAEITDDSMTIFDGGWQSTTTKSRLNALINEFCNAFTDGVFQKNYQWFVRDNNEVKEFESGYTFRMIKTKKEWASCYARFYSIVLILILL